MQIKIKRVFSAERGFEKQKRKKQSHSFDKSSHVMNHDILSCEKDNFVENLSNDKLK